MWFMSVEHIIFLLDISKVKRKKDKFSNIFSFFQCPTFNNLHDFKVKEKNPFLFHWSNAMETCMRCF